MHGCLQIIQGTILAFLGMVALIVLGLRYGGNDVGFCVPDRLEASYPSPDGRRVAELRLCAGGFMGFYNYVEILPGGSASATHVKFQSDQSGQTLHWLDSNTLAIITPTGERPPQAPATYASVTLQYLSASPAR